MVRQRELRLLLAACALGTLAFVIALENLGSASGAVFLQMAIVCAMAFATHIGVRRFAPMADPVLLPAATLLNLLGLAMIHRLDVADAQRAMRQSLPTPMGSLGPQAAWTVLGLSIVVAMLALLRDHRQLQRYTYTSMVAGIALLLMPLLPGIGAVVNGARLWVRVFDHSFQPGEFAKLFLAVFFAGFLVLKRGPLASIRVRRWGLGIPRARDLGPIVVAWVISVAVLVFERDLGMSLLLFGLFVTMLYSATAQRTWLVLGAVLFTLGAGISFLAFAHVHARVEVWLNPFRFADSQGYQVVQSLYGLASGGLFGTGLGNGFPNLIPFAHSDFILAAFGEELGFVGLGALLVLYAIVVERGLRIGLRARDGFGQLLATGLAVLLGVQTFIVAGGVTRLIPLTGLTTPFLSAGGSSLVANWMAIALLLRISDTSNRMAAT